MDSSQIKNSTRIENVADLDRRLMRRLRKASNDAWLNINLSLPSLRALLAIEREPGITPSELADYLGVARPAASNILDRLEADGLLQRRVNPADRRQFLITLTDAGRLTAERVDGQRRERLQVALARLSSDDLEALATGLTALEQALIAIESEAAAPALEGASTR